MKGNSKVIPDDQRAAGRCNAAEGNLKLAPERISGICEPCVRMSTLVRITPVTGSQADISVGIARRTGNINKSGTAEG